MTGVHPFLTIFTIPKPFMGQAAIHQENAVKSWVRLGADVQVILCGDEEGVAEAAEVHGALHAPDIERNDQGTPLVSSAFEVATELSTADLLCYSNADIVLMDDFVTALRHMQLRPFLLCGRRWDLDVDCQLEVNRPTWQTDLRQTVLQKGWLHSAEAMDYFAFPRGVLRNIPPFAVGRAMWDNWFVFNARAQSVPVVDATPDLVVVHQNHGYAHTSGGQLGAWYGPEASQNRWLAREMLYPFTIADATHVLKCGRVSRRMEGRALLHFAESTVALGVRRRPALRQLLRKLLRAKDG